MPFSHHRPRAARVSALATEQKTDGVRTVSSVGRTVSFSKTTNYNGLTGETKHTISQTVGNGDITTKVSRNILRNGAGQDGSNNFTQEKNHTQNREGGEQGANNTASMRLGYSTTNRSGGAQGSTSEYLYTSQTASESKQNVVKRTAGEEGVTLRVGAGQGYTENVTRYAAGATQGQVYQFFYTTSSKSEKSSPGGTKEDTTRTYTFSDGTQENGTISRRPLQMVQMTSLGTSERRSRISETYTTSRRTTFGAAGTTSIRTTGISRKNSYESLTFPEFKKETVILDNKPLATYGATSLHGGDFYGTEGETQENGFIVGAKSTTVRRALKAEQPALNLKFQWDVYYNGEEPTVNYNTIVGATAPPQGGEVISGATSEGIRMVATVSELNDYANFDTLLNTAAVYSTDTFTDAWYELSADTGTYPVPTTTEDSREINGVITQQCDEIQSYEESSYETTYSGKEGLSTVSSSLYTTTIGTGVSAFAVGQNTDQTRFGKSKSIWVADISDLITTASNVGWKTPSRDLITYDKGLQGGVQYKTSNDVSGAIREGRNVSIGHAYLTTTATTSHNAIGSTTSVINVTVNTSISGSYESFDFPLFFRPALNHYAPFHPTVKYGDIYYTGSNAYVHLSHSENGKSRIKCVNSYKYTTAKGDSTAEQTIDTTLFGVIKIQNGNGDSNFQKTKMYSAGGDNYGGGVYANRKGAIINKHAPATTYYAFGSNGSSQVAEGLTQVGNGYNVATKDAPKNAMIFLHETDQAPYAAGGAAVFNRRQ